MKIRSSIVTSVDVPRVIEDARDAELCRNLDLFRVILAAFWEDISGEPDVRSFDPATGAELLRLSGVFLSQFGHARGFPDYQGRAKDILTRAADRFEAQDLPEKAAETKVGLATCYWYSGEVEEHDAMLRSVEEEFGARPDHPVSVQIKLNRIVVAIWRGDRDEAMRLVNEAGSVISDDLDFRLRTQFHNVAGITSRIAGDPERSIVHAKESVRIAREAGNRMFLGMNLNNLAFVYRVSGQYDLALATSNEAIAVSEARGDTGWTAHFLDTKALIYLDQCEYDAAIEVIDKAIEIFSEGEDYGGFTDAMWTKCLCLLRLDRISEALLLFADLTSVAARQIGKVAVDKFVALFAKEVYPLKHFPLTDEVATFKRSRVIKAMRETGGHVGEAARLLGLRSQQHLSDILNNQFPDIYDELKFKRRARRSDAAVPKTASREQGVSRLIMPKNRTYSFDFAVNGDFDPQFYYFPRNMMSRFGVKTDAVVAMVPAAQTDSLHEGAAVLYVKDGTFRIGRLSFDQFSGLFLVDLAEFTFLSDVQLVGVPIGYCQTSQRNKRMMTFKGLSLVENA
jgi:tetratricopeptide (TPR) repeat protein